MKRLILAAVAALALTASVAAADTFIVGGEQIAHVEQRWDGAYVGVTGGRTFGKVQDISNASASAQDTVGLTGGVHAGYNWQLDNGVVLGVEGDILAGGPKTEWASGAYRGSDVVNATGSVRARLGYSINDVALPYVTAGVAGAHTTHTLGCTVPGHGFGSCKTGFDTEANQFVLGYTVGAGLELAVSENLSVRGEYRYTKFQDSAVTLVDPNALAKSGRNFASDNHAVLVGLSYKF